MSRKKKELDPEVIRLTNLAVPVVPGFTITNISEADIRELNAGRVPDWILETTESLLAWQASPAVGQAHDRAIRARQQADELTSSTNAVARTA